MKYIPFFVLVVLLACGDNPVNNGGNSNPSNPVLLFSLDSIGYAPYSGDTSIYTWHDSVSSNVKITVDIDVINPVAVYAFAVRAQDSLNVNSFSMNLQNDTSLVLTASNWFPHPLFIYCSYQNALFRNLKIYKTN